MRSFDSTVASVALLVAVFQGCSGSGDGNRLSVYPVSGKITMAGAPVANAIVTFSPKGNQPVAIGRTDAQGQYKMTTYDANDGAAAGEFVVLVSKEAPAAASSAPPAHGVTAISTPQMAHAARGGKKAGDASESSSVLPSKYSDRGKSDLALTVKSSGENVGDFDLKP